MSRRQLRLAWTDAYIAEIDLEFWQKALREAERKRDAATTRTTLDPVAEEYRSSTGRRHQADPSPAV